MVLGRALAVRTVWGVVALGRRDLELVELVRNSEGGQEKRAVGSCVNVNVGCITTELGSRDENSNTDVGCCH